MKKLFALVLMLIVFCVGNTSTVRVKASPSVLNVGPGQPFPNIYAALGVAGPGDIIHVWNNPLPYFENPVIEVPNIQIIGQSVAGVTVQAIGPEYCFTILAPGVTIMDLTIVDPSMAQGGVGVCILSSSGHCKIWNNVIFGFDHGVVIDNSPGNEIIGNEISNCVATKATPPVCSTAVYMQGSEATGNQIRGNELGKTAPNWYGVGIRYSASGNTIAFNNFYGGFSNAPQAFVMPGGGVNTWDDIALGKGNWWNDQLPRPPYVINPNNTDQFPVAVAYDWATTPWDINRDCKCDIKDVATAAVAFGAAWSTPRWNPAVDVIHDEKIDIKDIATIAVKFGWSDP